MRRRTMKEVVGDYPFRYVKGYCWDTEEDAEEHAKSLRRTYYGVSKHKTYIGVKIKRERGKWCTYAKESKGYIYYLRTGIC